MAFGGMGARNGGFGGLGAALGRAGASIIVPNGLVGYWPLDTASVNFPGNQALDISGNAITGTLANIPGPTVVGKVGQALSFNGTTSSIALAAGGAAANQLPTGTGAFSLVAWMFPTANTDQIVLNNDTVGFEQVDFRLNRAANGKVTIAFLQSDSTTIVCAGTTATSALVGVWTHVVATGDGTTLRVYVNGALEGSIAYSGIVKDVSGVWTIGRDVANAANPFAGSLDDIRIYKRAITGPEVTALYNAGLAIGLRLIASPGTFILTGDPMSQAYQFGAATGAFSLTGFTAAFLGANTLGASTGVFVETGNAAAFNITMSAANGAFTLTGIAATLTAPSSFTGPLDIASGAVVAYGLRALSAAGIGGNVIDIKRASDSTTQTFVSVSDGSLDIASITTFLAATTGTVTKWWDQSGNANHATNTGAIAFTLSASGLGTKPAITFDGITAGSKLSTASTVTAAQPAFVSAVANRRSGTGFSAVITANAAQPGLLFNNAANGMVVYGGSLGIFTVADGTFHAIGGLLNGASSQGYVNGVGSGALSSGVSGFSSVLQIGNFSGTPLAGDICEIILWASDKSASAAALSANQRAAAGYNF